MFKKYEAHILVSVLILVILALLFISAPTPSDAATLTISNQSYQYTFYTANYTVYQWLQDKLAKYGNVKIVYTGKQTPAPAPAPTPTPTPTPAPVNGLTADEQKMLNHVNQERAVAGVKPLQADLELTKLARMKSQDMIDKNYISHTSPTYGSPFDMMKKYGVTYRPAGENLAGAGSVDVAHKNLMNSPGHRQNILNSSYTHVGIGPSRVGLTG